MWTIFDYGMAFLLTLVGLSIGYAIGQAHAYRGSLGSAKT